MFGSESVFAVVIKPGDCGEISHELIMMKHMPQSVEHKEHPVVVIINTDQEKIKDSDVISKLAQIIARPLIDDAINKSFIEDFDQEIKQAHIEMTEHQYCFLPQRTKIYANVYCFENHWPRVCRWKNRMINRQIRLLQKKDCR